MRRKPRYGEGRSDRKNHSQRELRVGDGAAEKQEERGRCRGQEGEEGSSVCASRERGTVRWWDLFIVIPVLQLSSSLARPLINHSSTTHRLAKSPFLSRSWPPYRSRKPGRTPRGLSRERRWPTKRGEKKGGGESRTRLFMLWDSSSPPGVKLMKTEEASRKRTEVRCGN